LFPYITAAVVAAVVAGVEQYKRLGARPTLENDAWIWWGVRLLLEAGLGLIAVGLFRATHAEASDHFLGWVAAGAAAPAIVRLRFLDYGKGAEARPIGIATAYEPVRDLVEDQLHKRSSERQMVWINAELLPALERDNVDPATLASYAIDYLKGLTHLDPIERQKEIDYIKQIRDSDQEPRIKRETLARHTVHELGAFRVLDQFMPSREPRRILGIRVGRRRPGRGS
jgi:hypothetical protein